MTWSEQIGRARDSLTAHPALRDVVLASLIQAATTALTIAILPLYLLARGVDILALGGVYSVIALTTLVAPLIAGRWPHVFGRRSVVLALVLASALALPGYLFTQTALGLLLVAAARSLCAAAASPGLQLLIAEAAPAQRRAEVFGQMGALTSLAYAAGVTVGAAMLAVSFEAAFALASALALAGAGILARSAMAASGWSSREDPTRARLQATLARTRATRLALAATAPVERGARRRRHLVAFHLFGFTLALSVYPVYFPMHLVQQGLPLPWTGAVVASGWLTYALVQPFAGRFADRTGGHLTVVLAGLAAATVLNVALGLAPLAGIIVAWVVLGIADGVCRPMTTALLLQAAPRSAARALGLADLAAGLAGAIAPFALAFVIRGLGLPGALAVVGLTVALSAIPLVLLRSSAPQRAPTPLEAHLS